MEVLDRPAYAPLWTAARRRLESNGLSLDGGALVLKGLTAEEADAIAGLLGVRRPTGDAMRVSLRHVDQALRSSVVSRGLADVLRSLGGPLVDRPAARGRREADRAARWARLHEHRAVLERPVLAPWLDQVRATGLARRLAGEQDADAMGAALDALAAVTGNSRRYRLAVLAAEVTGDAHGLDRGRPAGTLAVHALAWLDDEPFPRDAADWRRTWSDAGVACDDLSCDVLVLNLPSCAPEPLRLTLRQASAWAPRPPAGGSAFVTENPAVLAAAADQLDTRAPTMVCLDGMPSTAALVILDGLATLGCAVRYHGDFDWRGLAIAAVLARKVAAARPWRFGAGDYASAVERGLGSVALSGRPSASPWDPDLPVAMSAAGVAVYEELVVDDLLDDLA